MDTNDPIPKNQSLAEIASEAMAIEEILLSQNGEVSPEIEKWIFEVETNLSKKADHYKFAMDRFNSTADLLKERAAEFTKAAKAIEGVSERLKGRIKEVMLFTGRLELHGRNYKFKIAPMQPKLVIHEQLLPIQYKRQVTSLEVDKELIKEAIKVGHEIKGVKIEPVHALRITVNKEN